MSESHDMDYTMYQKVAGSDVRSIGDVAKLCYKYDETWFRQEMMDWVRMCKTGRRYNEKPNKQTHFLRNCRYNVRLE